jgi:uncharacterized protein YggE
MWKLGAALTCAATLALSGTAWATGQQISVNGTGGVAVPAGANDVQQQTAYDAAVGVAITDAQTKAVLVAQHLSLTLGSVETFTEESADYLGYCGVGFLPGAAATGLRVGASAPAASATSGHLTPIPAKHKKHKKHKAKKTAHKAQADNSCQIEADVTVVYSAS